MTIEANALVSESGLIRWSAIQKHLKAQGADKTADKVESDLDKFGRTCDTHGYLEDPIVGIDTAKKQLIIACPFCSSPELLARWETQA